MAEHGFMLAKAAGRRLLLVRGSRDGLRPAGDLRFDSPVKQVSWLDARRLVVLLASGQVHLAREGRSRLLAPRPASSWTPPPQSAEEEATSGEMDATFPNKAHLLVDRGGEVWLAHCARYWQGDDDPCALWLYGRLGRRPVVRLKRPELRPEPGWQEPAGARGCALRTSRNDDGSEASLECRCAGQRPLRRTFRDGTAALRLSTRWVAPRLFVLTVSRDYGEGSPQEQVLLMRACKDKELVQAIGAVYGPSPVWVHDAPASDDAEGDWAYGSWIVRWGTRVLGRLPGLGGPVFCPAAGGGARASRPAARPN